MIQTGPRCRLEPRRVVAHALATLAAVTVVACGSAPRDHAAGAAAARTAVTDTANRRTPQPTATTSEQPPADGTELASYGEGGAVTSIADAGGSGFSIIDDLVNLHGSEGTDSSSVAVFGATGERLTTLPSEDLTGDCGAADVTVPGAGRLIITELITTHPAEGIKPATSEIALKAWNAVNGAPAWSATIAPTAPGGPPSCSEYIHEDATAVTTLEQFVPTPDAIWGLSTTGARPFVIDLRTGRLRADPRAIGILGNFIVDRKSNESPEYLTDPQSGRQVGSEPGRRGGREPTSIPYYGELSLAPQGVVQTDSDGTSPPAVLSSDGNVVIGLLAYSGTSEPGTELAAYSLPDGTELWHAPRINSVYLYGDAGGRVLVSEQKGEDTNLVALDDHTGKVDWQLPASGTVCGLTVHQMLLSVNGQLATIDASTGKQISYSGKGAAEEGSEGAGESCPSVSVSGLGIGGSSVEQVLQP